MNKFANKNPALRLLLSLLLSSKWKIIAATVACVANGIFSVLLVSLINKTMQTTTNNYVLLAWYFSILTVMAIFCRIISSVIFAKLSQGTIKQMRKYVSKRVANASLRKIEELGASRTQSVITDDSTNISLLFFALPNIVMQGSIVIGCLGYLAWLSFPIFLLAVTIIIIGSLGYILGGRTALTSLKSAGQAQDRMFAHFNALFSGVKELKLHVSRANEFLNQLLAKEIDIVHKDRTHAFSIYAFGVGWILLLTYSFLGLVVFSPTFIPELESTKPASYIIVFLFMLMPLEGVLNSIPTLNSARVSLRRISAVLSELDERESIECTVSESDFCDAHTIRLTGIQHNYYHEKEGHMFKLGPIDMTLKRGEITFLIGGNGSGKTTLAKLLTGLYTPESGTITVDGREVVDSNRTSYRQLFSAVFSDFHLFESLIGLNDTDSTLDARANALLIKLHLEHKVKVENGYFSTRNLSQGQRKRLALLVSYLEDRSFYLFDECAADQDPLFKDIFYQEIIPELAACNKAILVITHDDRYFHLADHCIKLENGHFNYG